MIVPPAKNRLRWREPSAASGDFMLWKGPKPSIHPNQHEETNQKNHARDAVLENNRGHLGIGAMFVLWMNDVFLMLFGHANNNV